MLTLYGGLADLVFLLHIAFIVFVLLGGLLALRWRLAPMAHLPAAAWGAAVEFFGWTCPLTPLEDALRRASGSPAPRRASSNGTSFRSCTRPRSTAICK
jgi:hypothetical protein